MDKKTIMWIAIGGGAFFFVAILAVILALAMGGGDSTTTAGPSSGAPPTGSAPASGDHARVVAACSKGAGTTRRQCDCLAKIVLAEFAGKERELLIRILEEGVAGDPQKMIALIQGQREINAMEFAQKLSNVMPRAARECAG